MVQKIINIRCDICGKSFDSKEYWDGKGCSPLHGYSIRRIIGLPVIFHTDQNDGSGTAPYIDYENIDICKECLMKSTNIHASGAQGYNSFQILKG